MSAELEQRKSDLREFFSDISTEVAANESLLISWAAGSGNIAEIDTLFRFFHNVKGASGMFGLATIQELFHNAESLLSEFREIKRLPGESATQLLLSSMDEFKRLSEYSLSTGEEPKEKPYELMANLCKERKIANSTTPGAGGTASENANGDTQSSAARSEESIRMSPEQGSELVEIVSEFIQLQNRLDLVLESHQDEFVVKNEIRRFSGRLQRFVLAIRLSPIQPLFNGLQRVAIDAARVAGKKIKLQVLGGDTRLDKSVIDQLRDPLVHMIRNSVDHGVETPQERSLLKKPEEGILVVEAVQQAGQVIVSLIDDGQGISPERVKAKALERGLISAEQARNLDQKEMIKLIFLPGFSTAEKVTSLSGRGVGMDAVKSAVERIGGTLEVHSEVGRGTKVALTLPLTLAIVKSLIFEVGKQLFAIPQVNVEEVVTESAAIARKQIAVIDDGQRVLHLRKSVVPVVSLASLLKHRDRPSTPSYVVIRHRGMRFAVEVGKINGTRDFVSQPLPELLGSTELLSGVNQLNSGEYISLLNLTALLSEIESSQSVGTDSSRTTNESGQTVSDIFRSQQKLVFFRSGKDLAIPVQGVRQVVQVPQNAVDSVGDRMFLTFDGKVYPVLQLSRNLGGKELEKRESYTAFLVQRKEKIAAILCEEFYGVHRLPNAFESAVKTRGVLGCIHLENKTFLLADLGAAFAVELNEEHLLESGKTKQDFHVLIAEDDSFFATCLGNELKSENIRFTVVPDGMAARDALEGSLNAGPEGRFHYLITDYEMPRMNGIELLRFVRSHPELASLPASLCTAVGDQSVRKEGHKLGIDAYTGKMNHEGLIRIVRNRQRGWEIGARGDSTADSNLLHPDGSSAAEQRLLEFEICGKSYGLEISCLKEISAAAISTRIPESVSFLSEIIGFRGQPIPVLDLRRVARAGLRLPLPDVSPKQIVAKFGNHLCAIWVDEVLSVRRLSGMDRSTGITRKEFGKFIGSLVGNVMWSGQAAIGLLDERKIRMLLEAAARKSGRAESDTTEAAITASKSAA